jgi:hypothetical protein
MEAFEMGISRVPNGDGFALLLAPHVETLIATSFTFPSQLLLAMVADAWRSRGLFSKMHSAS